ncbi:MAG: glycoside hydrolase N-terminal domain-containing protein [Clostridia bacterium]|nr:glycoside hydrolase N-terminal domain-containing protein [Clostridia bacterium]
MGVFIRILTIIMTVFSLISSWLSPFSVYREIETEFSDSTKASYSELFYELSETSNNQETWREGMVSGNGLQGVITSCAPYNDTLIYQNMHFNLPNRNIRYTPVSKDELEYVKQSITAGEDIIDNLPYDNVYAYHPGGVLRIKQNKLMRTGYARYTDYETAQVGVRYSDICGTWQRTTFTSKADGVTITEIGSSSTGSKVDITLSMDNISAIAKFGGGDETNLKYKKLVGENCDYISFVAHYPDYENSELKEGGYSTTVYVVAEGGTKSVVDGKKVKDSQYCADTNPQIKIKDADNVYLLAISDRTHTMGAYDDFAKAESYELVDSLVARAKAVADKYTVDGKFSYDDALKAHTDLFTPEYNKVTFKLGTDDCTKPNEQLVLSQILKDELNSDLMERFYYNARYAYLCCAGYETPRLGGIWCGEWNTSWGCRFTQDANVNLQVSSMNTSNLDSAYIGFANFILRQVPDWEENAYATHGYTDAIQAPVHSDSDKAILIESNYGYPFRYWNAGTNWMLQPLYETLMCYGDVQIPLNDEFDLERLKSVLSMTQEDLTDADIAAIEAKGYLDLRSEVLLPLLTKAANYWEQMFSPEYYTAADGSIHYEKGKTELNEGETYTILPSYSPENNPANYPNPSTANTAIDISACNNTFEMLIDIMKSVDENADTSKWEELLTKVPPYLYDETGALKEWATSDFEENNLHRHISHLYCAWPMFETQENPDLYKACVQAIENRASENEASHAFVHRALIAARLKDSENVTGALVDLVSRGIFYDSLMTNHHYNRSSAYCTDFAIGYLGVVHESLLYSYTGKIELLPAAPQSGFDIGQIKGLKARTQATIDEMSWDLEKGTATATITSDIAQTITVSCGISDAVQTVTFAAGETKTISF